MDDKKNDDFPVGKKMGELYLPLELERKVDDLKMICDRCMTIQIGVVQVANNSNQTWVTLCYKCLSDIARFAFKE